MECFVFALIFFSALLVIVATDSFFVVVVFIFINVQLEMFRIIYVQCETRSFVGTFQVCFFRSVVIVGQLQRNRSVFYDTPSRRGRGEAKLSALKKTR